MPEGDEDTIEEEIEGAADATISPLHSNSKQQKAGAATSATKDSSSEPPVSSRNHQNDATCTFAEEPIEFSESFKRKEGIGADASIRQRGSVDFAD